MDKTDKTFLGIFFAIVCLGVVGIYALATKEVDDRRACEAAGGYHLYGRGLSECVDPKIIIKVR